MSITSVTGASTLLKGALGVRKQPTQARAQATVEVLFEATTQLLAHATPLTTNTVAARAGVSVGTLYQYFANKQSLLYAWLVREMPTAHDWARVMPSTAPLGPRALDFTSALCAWWRAPARRAAWMAMDDATRRPLRLRVMRDWIEVLGIVAARDDEVRRDRWAHVTAVAGLLGAIGHALEEDAFRDAVAAQTARELALLVLGPLTWSTARWRSLCEQTPADLQARRTWSRGRPSREQPLRQWLRARPRQGRAVASVSAVVAAAGDVLEQGLEYTAERLAEHAGVSVGTIYRYFSDKNFAFAEFGIAQLARFTERMAAGRAGIYVDAPGAGIARLVRLTFEPMRSRVGRHLRIAMFEHNERRIIDQQIEHLCTLLRSAILRHPLCGIDADHLTWMFHAVDGVGVWLTAQDDLEGPIPFGHLVESTSQMVFTYCAADRPVVEDVLAGARPVADLRKSPGRPPL